MTVQWQGEEGFPVGQIRMSKDNNNGGLGWQDGFQTTTLRLDTSVLDRTPWDHISDICAVWFLDCSVSQVNLCWEGWEGWEVQ